MDLQRRLTAICGDALYCDISRLETVCNDIWENDEAFAHNEAKNESWPSRQKREQRAQRKQKIVIKFNMIGNLRRKEFDGWLLTSLARDAGY